MRSETIDTMMKRINILEQQIIYNKSIEIKENEESKENMTSNINDIKCFMVETTKSINEIKCFMVETTTSINEIKYFIQDTKNLVNTLINIMAETNLCGMK